MHAGKHQLVITGGLIFITCFSSCTSFRQKRESERIIQLLKEGQYTRVKTICHYSPSWDPTDSIFNLNVRFIHAYLNKFGYPHRYDFKSMKDIQGNFITRIYLDKIASMDSTLDSAYIEIDYYNPSNNYSQTLPVIPRLFRDFLKLAPPLITNFYLIKMKKGENYYISQYKKTLLAAMFIISHLFSFFYFCIFVETKNYLLSKRTRLIYHFLMVNKIIRSVRFLS